MPMHNTTVIILGGSSGIGLATAQAAQAEGAKVVITGRNAARLENARVALGASADARLLDAADESGTRDLFAGLPAIDHVFITAGQLVLDGKLAPDTASLHPALDTRFRARSTPPSTPHQKFVPVVPSPSCRARHHAAPYLALRLPPRPVVRLMPSPGHWHWTSRPSA